MSLQHLESNNQNNLKQSMTIPNQPQQIVQQPTITGSVFLNQKELQQRQTQKSSSQVQINSMLPDKQLNQKTIRSTFNNIKMRIAANKLVNQTNSHMFKNLTQYQQYLINDQSNSMEECNLKNLMQSECNRNSALINFLIQTQQQTVKYAQDTYKRIKNLEQKTTCLSKIPVISPSNLYKIAWDVLVMIFIVFYIFLVPIHIGFETPFENLISNELSEFAPVIFILDILVQLNTGYFNKGIPIKDKIKIVKNFLRNCLVTDVISVMPYVIYHYSKRGQVDYITRYQPENSDTQIGKFFLILFFLKLKRFTDIVKRLSEITHLSEKAGNFIKLIKLLFTIVLIAHFLTCSWIYIAVQEAKQHVPSWLDALQLQNSSWNQQYLRSLYFTIVTMITVGYGDVTPKTDAEYIVCIVMIILSCGVYAYTFNEIGHILKEFNRKKEQMNAHMRVINYYMNQKNISRELQYQVREYLEYYWTEVQDRDKELENKIISQLSDQLREQLQFEANKVALQNSKVFSSNFSERLLQKTVQLIKEIKCNPEQIIIQPESTYQWITTQHSNQSNIQKINEFGNQYKTTQQETLLNIGNKNSIFFIEKGSVELYFPKHVPGKPEQFFPVQTLTKGQNFGADSFFTGEETTIHVRSKEFTTLLQIRRDEFLALLKDFPDDYEQFCSIQDSIQFYRNYQQIGYFCQSCGNSGHNVRQCPMIHFFPKREKIIRQYNRKNNNFERQKQDRNQNHPKTKFRTLINQDQTRLITEEYQEENEELITYHIQQLKILAMEQKIMKTVNRKGRFISMLQSNKSVFGKSILQQIKLSKHSDFGLTQHKHSEHKHEQKRIEGSIQEFDSQQEKINEVYDSIDNQVQKKQQQISDVSGISNNNRQSFGPKLHQIDESDQRHEDEEGDESNNEGRNKHHSNQHQNEKQQQQKESSHDTGQHIKNKSSGGTVSDESVLQKLQTSKNPNQENEQQQLQHQQALEESKQMRNVTKRRGSAFTQIKKRDEFEKGFQAYQQKEKIAAAGNNPSNPHLDIMEKLEKSVQKIQDQLAATQALTQKDNPLHHQQMSNPSSSSNNKHNIHNSFDMSTDFESFKNFTTYFPYNNLNYQVQLLKLNPKDRKFLTQRMHLDNTLHNRKTFKEKQKFYQQYMEQLINQQEQEIEYQLERDMQKQIELIQGKKNIVKNSNNGSSLTQQQLLMQLSNADKKSIIMQQQQQLQQQNSVNNDKIKQQRESRLQKANDIFQENSPTNLQKVAGSQLFQQTNKNEKGKERRTSINNQKLNSNPAGNEKTDNQDKLSQPHPQQQTSQDNSFHLINISFDILDINNNNGSGPNNSNSNNNNKSQRQQKSQIQQQQDEIIQNKTFNYQGQHPQQNYHSNVMESPKQTEESELKRMLQNDDNAGMDKQ